MAILWDEPKRLANIAKHGLDFAALDEAFFEAATILPARSGRFKAVNWFDNRIVTVVFATVGSEAISVVSFRPAGRNERRSGP